MPRLNTDRGSYNIENSGSVRGWHNAVEVFGAGSIVNAGRIIGGWEGIAIACQGRVELTNTGTISGDILLGDGNDRVDTRSGIVRGDVNGGEGDKPGILSQRKEEISFISDS